MTDSRFFKCCDPLSAQELLEHLASEPGAENLKMNSHAAVKISDVNTLNEAGPHDVTFFHNKKYLDDLKNTRAGAVIVSPEFVEYVPKESVAIQSNEPYRTYARTAHYLYPHVENDFEACHKSLHPEAKIAHDVVIEPGVVINACAEIASGCAIGANTVIGRGVKIGKNTRIGANVTLSHCLIGANVTILPGARIGQAGFGFHMDEKGHISVPQLGRVIISDAVEIGSNTTIDRGTLEDTFIGHGTRIDNLVQIAHGVKLGEYCVIVSQVGISGSTHFGDYVIAAGQAGFVGHITVGNGAQVAAKAGVMRSVDPGQKMGGHPAVPIRQWHKQGIALGKLASSGVSGRSARKGSK